MSVKGNCWYKILYSRTFFFNIWLIFLGFCVGVFFFPQDRRFVIEILRFSCFCSLYFGTLILFWHSKLLRYTLVICLMTALSFLILPGKKVDSLLLKKNYLCNLEKYEGVSYRLGQEHNNGMDCSGLVKRALIDTLFFSAITTRNPLLLRESVFVMTHDFTVKDLITGYYGRIEKITVASSLNSETYLHVIQSGDLAATKDGGHVMAYLSNQIWIEADPTFLPAPGLKIMKVIKEKTPSENNPWFNTPVIILRWKYFENDTLW